MATSVRNVNITFTADTSAAKAKLQELQKTLGTLGVTAQNGKLGASLQRDISQGIKAASQLQGILKSAINQDTGKLDISKFAMGLKDSGQTLSSLKQNLSSLGPEGQKAFNNLATSLASAQMPLKATNGALDKMWVTMKNTMKWQISATALRAFTSAIRGAFDYAQDLNESLTNIRIVTDQSTEQMERFAEKANKAAKALSATTTAYTDAALIYYQQGLKDKAVEERTNTTIKLSNVTGKSADEVSQWMTAIWNNFDNGSKSLEYYADVITKLGANTASSSEEIATGLEKFAAVADTVGLSYEYATAALATVTAETRQSADVVGTAFKTLFARMQDLKLGETLEDGTTLGQYSEAMAKVGVDIKEASGELKDMDVILDELGATWGTLDKDQQVALAKSVAGLRQYNQFIALMANYDTFKGLVKGAETATGTLEKQNDKYAESWEGANKRVKASAEELYSALIDDKFFIGLTNGASEFIDIVNSVIEAMGGLKGLLPLLFVGFTKIFGDKMIAGIRNFSQNLKVTNSESQMMYMQMKQQALSLAGDDGSNKMLKEEAKLENEVLNINHQLTEKEQTRLKMLFDGLAALREQYDLYCKMAEKAGTAAQKGKEELSSGFTTGETAKEVPDLSKRQIAFQKRHEGVTSIEAKQGIMDDESEAWRKKIQAARDQDEKVYEAKDVTELRKLFKDKKGDSDEEFLKRRKLQKKDDGSFGYTAPKYSKAVNTANKATSDLAKKAAILGKDFETAQKQAKKFTQGVLDEADASNKAAKASKAHKEGLEGANKAVNKFAKVPVSQTIMEGAQAISSMAMGLSSLKAAWDTLSSSIEEGNFSFSTLLSVITSLSMGIPMLITATNTLTTSQGLSVITNRLYALTMTANQKAIVGKIMAIKGLTLEQKKQQIAEALGITLDKAGTLIAAMKTTAKSGEAVATGTVTAMTWKEVAAKTVSLVFDWQKLAVTLLLVAAFAALVAIIVAVIAVFKAISDMYNADSIAAKKAAEEADRVSEAYNNVRENYEKLKESFKKYKDAEDSIKKLRKGTEEWSKAISESNQEVMDLLKTYPELAKYLSTDEGYLKISEEGWQKLLSKQQQTVAIMANLSAAADIRAKETSLKAQRTELYRRNGISQEQLETIEAAFKESGNAIFANNEIFNELGIDNENIIQSTKELMYSIESLDETIKAQNSVELINALQSVGGFNEQYHKGAQKNILEEQYNQQKAQLEQESEKLDLWSNLVDDTAGHMTTAALGTFALANIWNPAGWTAGLIAAGAAVGNELLVSTQVEGDDLKPLIEAYMKTNYSDIDMSQFDYDAGDEEEGVEIEYDGTGSAADTDGKSISYEQLRAFWVQQQMKIENLATQASAMTGALIDYEADLYRKEASGQKISDEENALLSYLQNGSFDYFAGDVNLKSIEDMLKNNYSDIVNAYGGLETLINQMSSALENRISGSEIANNISLQKKENYENEITAEAEKIGISTYAIKAYSESLIENNDVLEENSVVAARAAASHYKMAKGIKSLRETYNNWRTVLASGKEDTYDYYEALGALAEQMKNTFGFEVSTDFIEKNMSKIRGTIDGNIEAFKELKKELALEFVVNLGLSAKNTDELKNSIKDLIKELENSTNISVNLKADGVVEKLNDLALQGKITGEQIEGIFSTLDLSLDNSQYRLIEMPTVAKKRTISETQVDGGKVVTTDTRTTDITYTQIPWIGDNPPKFKVESSGTKDSEGFTEYTVTKVEGTGKASGAVANRINANAKGLLNYDGGESSDKQKKDLDEVIDRYHEIDKTLEDISRKLDNLSEKAERAFGITRIAIFKEELKGLEEEGEKLQEKLSQITKDYKTDSGKALGWGAKLDEDGNITNYNELKKKYANMLNNKQMTQDQYDTFESDMSQYETTLSTYKDTADKIVSNEYSQDDKKLAIIEYEVEYKIEASERGLEYIDYALEKIEDDAYKAAEAISLLGNSSTEYMTQANTYKQGISDILTKAGGSQKDVEAFMSGDTSVLNGLNLTANDVSALQDYASQLLSINQSLEENHNATLEKLTEAFENIGEEFDNVREKMDGLAAAYDNVRNITDLVGKDILKTDAKFFKTLNEGTINANKQILQNSINEKKVTENALAQLKKDLASATSEEEKEDYEEKIEAAEKRLLELDQNIADDLSSLLESVNQAFEDSLTAAADALDEALGGVYNSFEKLTNQFDKQKELSELYLQDYQKMYETSKMIRDIEKKRDSTENIKAQRELAALQEEVAKFQADGAKMSQYDVEHLQKKYDLTLAQIALEEAQNAKSQITLRQDSSGNYGYVYTADENNISKAEEDFEQAQYEYQDWAYQSELALTEQRNQAIQNMMSELAELRVQDYTSEQEYYAARQEIIEHYTQITGFCYETLTNLMTNNADMNVAFNMNMADSFNETLLGRMYPDMQSFVELQGEEFDTLNQYTEDSSIAYDTWRGNVEDALNQVGTSADTFAEDMVGDEGYLTKVDEKINKLGEDSEELVTTTDNAFKEVCKKVKDHRNEYNTNIQEYIKTNEALYKSIGSLITQYSTLINKQQIAANPPDIPSPGDSETPDIGEDGDGENPKGEELKTIHKAVDNIGKAKIDSNSWVKLDDKYWYKRNDVTRVNSKGEVFDATRDSAEEDDYYFTVNDDAVRNSFTDFNLTEFDNVARLGNRDIYRSKKDGNWYGVEDLERGTFIYQGTRYGKIKSGSKPENHYLKNKYVATPDTDYCQTDIMIYNASGNKFTYSGSDFDLPKKENGGAQITEVNFYNGGFYYRLKTSAGGEYHASGENLLAQQTGKYDLIYYDTGGYTGEWGPEGRIAMLHQKEIVLNAHDTENFLDIVEMVRDMQEMNFDNTLNQFASTISQYTSNIQTSSNETKQDVYINADFSGVSSAAEIEEAFNHLLNEMGHY